MIIIKDTKFTSLSLFLYISIVRTDKNEFHALWTLIGQGLGKCLAWTIVTVQLNLNTTWEWHNMVNIIYSKNKLSLHIITHGHMILCISLNGFIFVSKLNLMVILEG